MSPLFIRAYRMAWHCRDDPGDTRLSCLSKHDQLLGGQESSTEEMVDREDPWLSEREREDGAWFVLECTL